jgi:hypothetical protein
MTPREVLIRTSDHGTVLVSCPPWCIGHAGQDDGAQADIAHEGPEHILTLPTEQGPVALLSAGLEQRPYAEHGPDRGVFVNVEVSGEWHPADPGGLDAMADALTDHAATLHAIAEQLRAATGTPE